MTPALVPIPGIDQRYQLARDGSIWSCRTWGGNHERTGPWRRLKPRNGSVLVRREDGRRTERSLRRAWLAVYPGELWPLEGTVARERVSYVVHLAVGGRPACGIRSLDARISSLPERTTCGRCRRTEAWEAA